MHLSKRPLTSGTEETSERTPTVSLILAYAAMVPLAVGATVALVSERAAPVTTRQSIKWGGAVLCFLGGVRRGLSFRQPGGTTVGEASTMVSTFVLGAGALLSPWQVPSLVLLLIGFGAHRDEDVRAAQQGEAPHYFARLRPAQMTVPLLSLGALLLLDLSRRLRSELAVVRQ